MESTSSMEEDTKIDTEPLIQNVDVMMLHTESVMNNFESFYKVLIAYLIEQQYRRSEEAQEVRRADAQFLCSFGLYIYKLLNLNKFFCLQTFPLEWHSVVCSSFQLYLCVP